jgi:hypothetical protein
MIYDIIKKAMEYYRDAEHVTRVLDDGDLHAEADAQEGLFVGSGVVGSQDLALHPPVPEAS